MILVLASLQREGARGRETVRGVRLALCQADAHGAEVWKREPGAACVLQAHQEPSLDIGSARPMGRVSGTGRLHLCIGHIPDQSHNAVGHIEVHSAFL